MECRIPRETFPPILIDFLAVFSRGKLSSLLFLSLLCLEDVERLTEDEDEVEIAEEVSTVDDLKLISLKKEF